MDTKTSLLQLSGTLFCLRCHHAALASAGRLEGRSQNCYPRCGQVMLATNVVQAGFPTSSLNEVVKRRQKALRTLDSLDRIQRPQTSKQTESKEEAPCPPPAMTLQMQTVPCCHVRPSSGDKRSRIPPGLRQALLPQHPLRLLAPSGLCRSEIASTVVDQDKQSP